jgi:hypothetical protein
MTLSKYEWGGTHTDNYAGRLHVLRTILNKDGYTSAGTYFGVGKPLYHVCDDDQFYVDYYIRAIDRHDALRQVRLHYPNAKVG